MDQDMVRDVQCCDDDHGDGDEGENDDDGDGDDDDGDGINLFVGFTTFNTLLLYHLKANFSSSLRRKVPCCKTYSHDSVHCWRTGRYHRRFFPDWEVPLALQLLQESKSGAGEEAPPPVIVGGVGYGSGCISQATRI